MKQTLFFFAFLLLQQLLWAQPYLDVAAVSYQGSPDAGVFRRSFAANSYQYGSATLNP